MTIFHPASRKVHMVTTVTCDRFITRLFIKLLNLHTLTVELGYSNTALGG